MSHTHTHNMKNYFFKIQNGSFRFREQKISKEKLEIVKMREDTEMDKLQEEARMMSYNTCIPPFVATNMEPHYFVSQSLES